jgi:uncharacterized protein YkwD
MAVKRAFRPTGLDGREQLEARLVLSHAKIAHLLTTFLHNAGHHPVIHVVHPVHKHGHGGTNTTHNGGSNTQTSTTTPVIVVPVQNPPTSSPGQGPTATSTSTTTTTTTGTTTGTTTTTTTLGVPTVSGVMSAQEQTIVDLVNQQRAQAGLAPLQVDSRLVEAAQIHSKDMATLGLMEHTLPGAALPALQDRAHYVGYNYSYLGENIAFNYPDDNSVMVAWMNSPGHRANILNPNYTQIGVGIAYDSLGEPYYTQEFGSPA